MKPLIIYHDHCTDGYGAAFAAWLKFKDGAEYLPASYGSDIDFDPRDREVYVLDFSFSKERMDFLFEHAKKVVWLDHHKTAFEMWCDNKEYFYDEPSEGSVVLLDNNKSGALLAWEYFHPGTEIPHLISRIDDRDRWVFKYGDSKALHAGLAAEQPWSFDRWQGFLMSSLYYQLIVRGHAILEAQDSNVQRMAQQAIPCEIPWNSETGTGPFSGRAVNASIHQSELGHVVATKSGTYALIWYLAADGRVNCSLRSNGDYDVSAIAKTFGGGGHKNAAGFQTDINTLVGWLK